MDDLGARVDVERAFVAVLRARCLGARVQLGDEEVAKRMGRSWDKSMIDLSFRLEYWDVLFALKTAIQLGCFGPADVMALSNAPLEALMADKAQVIWLVRDGPRGTWRVGSVVAQPSAEPGKQMIRVELDPRQVQVVETDWSAPGE